MAKQVQYQGTCAERMAKRVTSFCKESNSNKPTSTLPSKQTSKNGLNLGLFEVFIGLNANVYLYNEYSFLDYQAFG